MNPDSQSNPVFAYRAAFRVFAARVQKSLILGGLLVAAIGLGGTLLANSTPRIHHWLAIACAAGPVLILLGVIWGFYWRIRIRNEFRAKFGPRDTQ